MSPHVASLIATLLAEDDVMKSLADEQKTIRDFHELSINVPFGLTSVSDNHDPAQGIAQIYASGLGLPDRDYYLKPEPRFEEARQKYVEHVANTFRLAGMSEAAARSAAESVFAQEKSLAQASLDNVALRAPQATDHTT